MTKIDKKDIENIENLEKILKSKKLNSVKIKKEGYEIEVVLKSENLFTATDNVLKTQEKKSLEQKNFKEEQINKENIISSPMVGVIYLAPETTKPPL